MLQRQTTNIITRAFKDTKFFSDRLMERNVIRRKNWNHQLITDPMLEREPNDKIAFI
jgi:hypothetical protein